MGTAWRSSAVHVTFLFTTVVACSTVDADDPNTCTGSSCRPPECSDGKRSADETGVDCGGSCGACDGDKCTATKDCARGTCTGGKCVPPATKTCGAGLPKKCELNEKCQQDIDCANDYCEGSCVAPPANVHEDGRRNAGETGKDCGGTATDKPCPGGEACVSDNDCQSHCTGGTCTPPTATDGKKNQGESDIDCGGPNAPKCLRGKVCATNDDCQLEYCNAGHCDTPANDDKIVNGSETDVDCGGAGVTEGTVTYKAPVCNDLKKCKVGTDCRSGQCSPAGVCVPPSCNSAETAGLTSCGPGEPDDPAAVHESCCKSLQLPTHNARLDKYEITAGRFRTFLTVVGPNVRQWVQTFASQNPDSQLGKLVKDYPSVLPIYPAATNGSLGLVQHMAYDIDNYNGIRGCYNGAGDYAANTYWQDATALAQFSLPARPLPRETTDAKSLNCAMPIMFAAFCAWDGGSLATRDDLLDAWGPDPYPWGTAPIPQTPEDSPVTDTSMPNSTNYNWCNGDPPADGQPGTGGFKCQNASLGNNGTFYRHPAVTNLANDMSPLIAGPGRFPKDATKLQSGGDSWMDVFANLAEVTGDFSGTNDFCEMNNDPGPGPSQCFRKEQPSDPTATVPGTHHTNIPNVGIVGRTWEGHVYDRGAVNVWPATGQYGKFGGRCVRPLE